MQLRRLFHGVKGAARLAKYASLWEHAMTDEAKRRIKILSFWEKYGLKTTLDAFGTKRRTLFRHDHEHELLDPAQFNVGLMQHLLWHNTQRPHWSLKMKPPVQFIQDNFSHPECNMGTSINPVLGCGCVEA